jgi:hypothetical protein
MYVHPRLHTQPSDDTFLLMDAIAADKAALRALRPRIAVEIGYVSLCGSGRFLCVPCTTQNQPPTHPFPSLS